MTTATKVWITVVLVALIGVYEWLIKQPAAPLQPPPKPIRMDHMTQKVLLDSWDKLVNTSCKPARGSAAATWTLIEIGDFECPQCGKVHKDVEKMVDESKGNVKLYFLNWPLPMHHNSVSAAAAVLAGERQGKFWQMYDAIYGAQKGIDNTPPAQAQGALEKDAEVAGLDIALYRKDHESNDVMTRLMTQKQLVSSLGAQSTPTFLLRKDGSRQVNWFIGLNGQPASPGIPEYLGLKYLLANRPWAGAALPMPPAEPAAAMPTQVRN